MDTALLCNRIPRLVVLVAVLPISFLFCLLLLRYCSQGLAIADCLLRYSAEKCHHSKLIRHRTGLRGVRSVFKLYQVIVTRVVFRASTPNLRTMCTTRAVHMHVQNQQQQSMSKIVSTRNTHVWVNSPLCDNNTVSSAAERCTSTWGVLPTINARKRRKGLRLGLHQGVWHWFCIGCAKIQRPEGVAGVISPRSRVVHVTVRRCTGRWQTDFIFQLEKGEQLIFYRCVPGMYHRS